MKKILLNQIIIILFIVICSKITLSQTNDNYYELYSIQKEFFDSIALAENIEVWEVKGYKEFARWADFFKYRNGENGSIGKYVDALKNYYDNGDNFNTSDYLNEWTYLGHQGLIKNHNGSFPSSVGQGWINCIWVNPGNIQHILAGSHNGGIWKTLDGGDSWESITDDYKEIKGIRDIYVLPNNIDHIFVTTTTLDQYSNGLFFTNNGGDTWEHMPVNVLNEGNYYPTPHRCRLPNKWIVNPQNNQIMWLITFTQVLRSIDGGDNWKIVIDRNDEYGSGNYSIWWHTIGFRDIEFDPYDNSIVYVSGYEAFRAYSQSDDYDDLTFSLLNGNNCPTDAAMRIFIGTHKDIQNKIWFSIYTKPGTEQPSKGILECLNTVTNELTVLATDPKIKADHTMQCEVSPVNANHIVLGGIRTAMYNGDLTSNNVDYISNNGVGWDSVAWVHSDIRDVSIVKDQDGNEVIFLAHDGSVSRGNFEGHLNQWHWSFIGNDGSDGIINGESWGFDCSDTDDDIMYTGFQDMNSAVFDNGIWYHILYNDGSSGLIDKTDPNYIYATYFGGDNASLDRSDNKGEDFGSVATIVNNQKPPLLLHPSNPNFLFVGGYRKLYLFNDIRNSNSNNPILEIGEDPPLPDPNPNNYSITGSLKITEIAIAESNPDVMFCSTERYFPNWANNYIIAKALYRSTDGGAGWDDLSLETESGLIDALSRGSITGIVINPLNEQEIWICLGEVSLGDNPADIIFTSDDGGETWHPMSQQPEKTFPGNDLQYEKNSGVLYFANDIGVYLFNSGINEWQKINNKLPPNIVKFIRFNHGLNKINVATYGRGIWQTDIPCLYNGIPETITEDLTWSEVKHIYSDVIIDPGWTLTVTNKVFLSEGVKIIVKRGGKLIIDGGTLTNACDGMWKGIEVWGDPTKSSVVGNQGLVWIKNGGVIENAECGIRAVRMAIPDDGSDEGEIARLEYSGGIVWANDAEFINNKEAVRFYKYPATGYTHQHSSFFWTVRFETNDDYPGSSHPDYFVNLSEINKVNFKGCEFINNTTQQSYQTGGIYSFNSIFYVEGNQYGSTWQNNLFKNMYYGIYAIASNPNPFADIRHSTFDLNFRGLYISGMTNARVTSNLIKIDDPFSINGGYGLYLNGSTGYWVEDNDFMHEGQIPKGVGLIINNSGTKPNEIYRNRFNNLTQGISAQQQNSSTYGTPTGLQILCNDFDICTADVLVPKPKPGYGIAPFQGSNSSQPTDMAGNLFYIPGPVNGDFDDINNQGRHVTYYYPSNYAPGYIRVKPVDYTQNTVTLEDVTVSTDWTPENGCPSGIEGGGGGGGERSSGELMEDMAEAQQKIDSTQNLLAMLVDGGSTEALQEDVEYSFPPEAMAIYNELIDNSPYLSDTVVSTAIEKEEVLPGAMIRDVMVANPHTAKNDELMNKLDERWTPLPEYMKEQILQGKNIVSVLEKTESKLGRFKLDKARAMNELERIYRNDTIGGLDSLAALYTADGDLESKYKLAFLSGEQGAWSMGMTTLNSIADEFELNSEQQAEYEKMVEFYTLLASLSDSAPDSVDVQELSGIIESEKGVAAMYALNMLIDLDEIAYEEPIEMPDFMKSASVNGSFSSIVNNPTPKFLKVMPNPAKEYIILEYELEMQREGIVEIADVTGKPVYSVQVSNPKDQMAIDTRKWKPGVYIALLKFDGKLQETVKFAITD